MPVAKPKPIIEFKGKQFNLKGRKLERSAGTGPDRLTQIVDLRRIFAKEGVIETLKKFKGKGQIKALYLELGVKFTQFLEASFTVGDLFKQGLTPKQIVDEYVKLTLEQKKKFKLNKTILYDELANAGAPKYEIFALLTGKDPNKTISIAGAEEFKSIRRFREEEDIGIIKAIDTFFKDLNWIETTELSEYDFKSSRYKEVVVRKAAWNKLYHVDALGFVGAYNRLGIDELEFGALKRFTNAIKVLREISVSEFIHDYDIVSRKQDESNSNVVRILAHLDSIKEMFTNPEYSSALQKINTGFVFDKGTSKERPCTVYDEFLFLSGARTTEKRIEKDVVTIRQNVFSVELKNVLASVNDLNIGVEERSKIVKSLMKKANINLDKFVIQLLSSQGAYSERGNASRSTVTINRLFDIFGVKSVMTSIIKFINETPNLEKNRLTSALSYMDFSDSRINNSSIIELLNKLNLKGIVLESESLYSRLLQSEIDFSGPFSDQIARIDNNIRRILESKDRLTPKLIADRSVYVVPLAIGVMSMIRDYHLNSRAIAPIKSLITTKFGKQISDLVFAQIKV